jgi:hypothetical protein
VPVVLFDFPAAPGERPARVRQLGAAVASWRGVLIGTTADRTTAAAVRALGVAVLDKPFADGEPLATIRRLLRRATDRR